MKKRIRIPKELRVDALKMTRDIKKELYAEYAANPKKFCDTLLTDKSQLGQELRKRQIK